MNFKEKVGIQKSNPEADLDVGKTALIDGSIPLMFADNLGAYVPAGLEVGYDGQYAVINPGIGYNKKRVHLENKVYLKLTNTGAAHDEDAIINSHGDFALTLDINSELDPHLYLGTVGVDASGNGTSASGDADRNLYLGDAVVGWKKLSDLLGGPNSVVASGTISIDATSAYTPAKGWWNFTWDNVYIMFQMYVDSDWRGNKYQAQGTFWCDGTNMRLYNDDSSAESFFYQQLQ